MKWNAIKNTKLPRSNFFSFKILVSKNIFFSSNKMKVNAAEIYNEHMQVALMRPLLAALKNPSHNLSQIFLFFLNHTRITSVIFLQIPM